MIVYYHGSPGKPPGENQHITVCPGGHMPRECEAAFWWDETGEKKKAKEFVVHFRYGEAEVEDQLGKYLVGHGFAMKHRFQQPSLWTPERPSLQG